jgi:hypothetical protein
MRLYQRLRVIHDALRVGGHNLKSEIRPGYKGVYFGYSRSGTRLHRVGLELVVVQYRYHFCADRTFVGVCAMFAIRLVPDHDLVIDTVGVRAPLGVLSFVVLHDKALFPFGNVVPVSFESDW